MLFKLFIALGLMALCVAAHAVGLTSMLRWVRQAGKKLDGRLWPTTRLLIWVATWTVLVHLLEISLWAGFYAWKQGMPDLQSAFYFSAVTYTTTGYGDLVLPVEWRLVGGVEALTGILMCGWSTGVFFAVVNQINEASAKPAAPNPSPSPGSTVL